MVRYDCPESFHAENNRQASEPHRLDRASIWMVGASTTSRLQIAYLISLRLFLSLLKQFTKPFVQIECNTSENSTSPSPSKVNALSRATICRGFLEGINTGYGQMIWNSMGSGSTAMGLRFTLGRELSLDEKHSFLRRLLGPRGQLDSRLQHDEIKLHDERQREAQELHLHQASSRLPKTYNSCAHPYILITARGT